MQHFRLLFDYSIIHLCCVICTLQKGPTAVQWLTHRVSKWHYLIFISMTGPLHSNVLHRVSKKTKQICFCQNCIKFPPILIIFGRKMANDPELVLKVCPTCTDTSAQTTIAASMIDWSNCAHSLTRRVLSSSMFI